MQQHTIDYIIFLARDCQCPSEIIRDSLRIKGLDENQIDAAFFAARGQLCN